jgi:hypothetical protein
VTLEELRATCLRWQAILQLRDWRIKVEFGRPEDMAGELGEVVWDAEDATAKIKIAPNQKRPEATLVHELLHVRMEGHAPNDGTHEVGYERNLNHLQRALMGLDRQKSAQ